MAHRAYNKLMNREKKRAGRKRPTRAQMLEYERLRELHRAELSSRADEVAVSQVPLAPRKIVRKFLPDVQLDKSPDVRKGIVLPGLVGAAATGAFRVGMAIPGVRQVTGKALGRTIAPVGGVARWAGGLLTTGAVGSAVTAAMVAGDQFLGDRPVSVRRALGSVAGILDIVPALGGEGGPPVANGAIAPVVVGQWSTGTAVFYRLSDGRIATQKRNGVWKAWRPYRPVVIPKKWDARAMSRVATALKRQRKTATKILQLTGGVPKRAVPKARGRMRALPAGAQTVMIND